MMMMMMMMMVMNRVSRDIQMLMNSVSVNTDHKQTSATVPVKLSGGHSKKVTKKGFRLDVGKFSFNNRVVIEWNAQTEEVIAYTVNHWQFF